MHNDGFNERINYINNSVDKNRINKFGPTQVDSSFAQMNVNSHKKDIETINRNNVQIAEEVKGNRENFVIRNKNIMNAQNMFRKQ